MADWLSGLTDEKLADYRESVFHVMSWLYIQAYYDSVQNERYLDIADILWAIDAEIERRKRDGVLPENNA